MPKMKLPPRIDVPGDPPDFARPVNSLNELAEFLGVSVYKLRRWRQESSELRKGRPYSVGKCALELIALEKLPKDSLSSLNRELQMAIAFDVAIDAVEHQHVKELVDSLVDNSDALNLILTEDDPQRLSNGLAMCGPLKPKTWKPLSSHESVVIAVASPKTAALFFDRVWSMDQRAPADIGVRFQSLEEMACLGIVDSLVNTIAVARGADEENLAEVEKKMMELDFETTLAQMFESMVLAPVKRSTGRDVPVFASSNAASRQVFTDGEKTAALSVMENVPLIDEKRLTWEQVVEIRKDTESKKKLFRFLHWLEKEYSTQPLPVIRDGIELKLSEYEEAAKKHGIERSLGRLSVLLDGSLWMAVVSAWNEVAAGVAGICVMGARALVEHYKYKVLQRELDNQNPAAYIYEVKSRTE